MSNIHPALQEKFEALSPELQKEILSRDVQINTLGDFIAVLENIVAEN